jgi:hypothetical protein
MRIQRRDAETAEIGAEFMPSWRGGGMGARRKQRPSFARMHKAEPYATLDAALTCQGAVE